ncbi:MAG: S41 family peptidase [Candidatus Paceibacterota bacterium]|jgi:carboxyl-terminal processing protease
MRKFIQKNLQSILTIIFIIVISGASFYFGYRKGVQVPATTTIQGVTNIDKGKPQGVDFSIFWETWQKLKDKYVDQNIDDQKLVYGAVTGLVNSLGDPHTNFFPPTDAQKFQEDVNGSFGGIGAEIDVRNNQLQIVAPMKGTPAEKAGLRSGDKILKVDDLITDGLTTDEAVKHIRGEAGTKVTLTIMRDGWSTSKEITITREIIEVPTLDWKILDNNIAYIHLYNFYQNSPSNFYQAAVEIYAKNPKAIIFDLRDNPGGYLEAATNISGWFLNTGDLIVSEQFRSGEKQEFKSSGNGAFKDTPIVLLVNEGSASASEILAGALRDDRKIELVGTKTFGKGTVQEVVALTDGSSLKVTIAHWLLPSGHVIEKNGLTPDYEVNLTEDDIKNGKDPQLDKAIEVANSKIQNGSFKTLFDSIKL